jgi:transcriptional regulator with XRE-family HTH domain
VGGAKGLNLSIFSRIKQIATYRNLPQTEIGTWFGISPAAWGKRERGESKGFPLDELQTFLEKTQIDARWLFGQIEGPIEEADLRLRGPEKSLIQQLAEEVKELRKRTRPLKELDPLADRIVNDVVLKRIVEKMIRKRASLHQVEGYIDGLEAGLADGKKEATLEEDSKKENAG